MNVCGLLKDSVCKNFVGTIDFKKGSKKSVGDECEYCILLSDEVKANSTPILLSAEEDVDGKHSSSVGKIDEDELFYLMSRGITKDEALKLLIMARLSAFANNLNSEKVRDEILKRIDKNIDEK